MSIFEGMDTTARQVFEEESGITTQGALRIIEEAERRASETMQKAIREIQEVIGPHGSVTRVQAGGVHV